MSEIYKAAKVTDRHDFRLEDFYFTGILRQKAKLPDPYAVLWNSPNGIQSLCHHYADMYTIGFERDLNTALENGHTGHMLPIQ